MYVYSCNKGIRKIQNPYSRRRLPAMVWLPPTGKVESWKVCVVPFVLFLFVGQIKNVRTQDLSRNRLVRSVDGGGGAFFDVAAGQCFPVGVSGRWTLVSPPTIPQHAFPSELWTNQQCPLLASHRAAVWGSGDTTPSDGHKTKATQE